MSKNLLGRLRFDWSISSTYGVTSTLRQDLQLRVLVFDIHPTKRACVAQGRFQGGSDHRALAQTRLAIPKISRASSAFPLKVRLRRQVINLTHPERVKASGDGPVRPEVFLLMRHTPPEPVECTTRPAKV